MDDPDWEPAAEDCAGEESVGCHMGCVSGRGRPPNQLQLSASEQCWCPVRHHSVMGSHIKGLFDSAFSRRKGRKRLVATYAVMILHRECAEPVDHDCSKQT